MKLQLIPGPLWVETAKLVTAPATLSAIHALEVFWVERAKTARLWLKEFEHPKAIQSLEIVEFERESLEHWQTLMIGYQQSNQSVGLLSEAGCPAVADPGAAVVRLAHDMNIEVEALPGSSAITLALMASGFNGQQFCFHGYVPISIEEKRKKLSTHLQQAWANHETQIYIETPYRSEVFINHLIALSREWKKPSFVASHTKTLGKANRAELKPPSALYLSVASGLTGTAAQVLSKPLSTWSAADAKGFNNKPAMFLLAFV